MLAEAHPLYNLVQAGKLPNTDRVPHVFFADGNGENLRGLRSNAPQSQLWRMMLQYLDRSYSKKATTALSGMRKLLSQYDMVDEAERAVNDRIRRETVRNGQDSPGLEKLRHDLQQLAEKRAELREREEQLRDLVLKPANEPDMVGPPDPISGVK